MRGVQHDAPADIDLGLEVTEREQDPIRAWQPPRARSPSRSSFRAASNGNGWVADGVGHGHLGGHESLAGEEPGDLRRRVLRLERGTPDEHLPLAGKQPADAVGLHQRDDLDGELDGEPGIVRTEDAAVLRAAGLRRRGLKRDGVVPQQIGKDEDGTLPLDEDLPGGGEIAGDVVGRIALLGDLSDHLVLDPARAIARQRPDGLPTDSGRGRRSRSGRIAR